MAAPTPRFIFPLLAIALIALGCLGSLLYVSDGNAALKEENHWLKLQALETKYTDVRSAVAKGSVTAELRERARALANIYRQNGKEAKAAEIYRLLWLNQDKSKISVPDGLELASIYSDMGAFSSAVDCYETILKQDIADLQSTDPLLVRDYNNLAQCCYLSSCANANAETRKRWLKTSIDNAQLAATLNKSANYSTELRRREVSSVIEQNLALSRSDLSN